MIKLNEKTPEKDALRYKNKEVYLSTYKFSSTLQQIAKERNLTFLININDICDRPIIFGRVKKFIQICKKYGVGYRLVSFGKEWEKRDDDELKFVRYLFE